MKKICFLILTIGLASCATNSTSSHSANDKHRKPSASEDMTGDYLGEGIFAARKKGQKRPAVRMYLDRAQGETDSYYGVLVEYPFLPGMAPQYIASQKDPRWNNVIGYLKNISAEISAYKFVPGQEEGTYEMHNLVVKNGEIIPEDSFKMLLKLDPNNKDKNLLSGAVITGYPDGNINFPSEAAKDLGSQYKLAKFVYKKGHLASTWRGNWDDLEGSYLSAYARMKDGVLELYKENGQRQMKFIKSNRSQPKDFTNPKSAPIEGEYIVNEPVPKMYVLTPVARAPQASDVEITSRIGLFLDVFDGSAPEAGSHLVTELAFTNSGDPKDFLMYYEHPDHAKNVGVEPPK